jgi:Concanavalin A-like lectin/glucanases superfamily
MTPAPALQASGDISLTSGLVSYWKLDDASRTSIVDSVGSNAGTWIGTLGSQWGTGKINGAGSFNGTDNYISNFGTSISPVGSSRSICAWLKTASTSRGGLVNTRAAGGFGIDINRTASGYLSYGHAGASTLDLPAGITVGVWYYGCATYNVSTSTAALYLNGAPLGTMTSFGAEQAGTNNGQIGAEAGFDFKGNIDEVGIWNRALTPTEISTLYNAGAGNPFSNISCGFNY